MNADNRSSHYPIIGRPDVDLSKYLVDVQGRSIIDYEKLEKDNPDLYSSILQAEHEANARYDLEHDQF